MGEVITNRLKAMRKLQQNPNDSEALALMQMAEDQVNDASQHEKSELL